MDNKPGDIVSGKVIYTIDDFLKDFRAFIDKLGENKPYNKEEKRNHFKHLFIFVLLSACDKSSEKMSKVLQMPEDKVVEGKELFKREIDVLRAIWMTLYLDILKTHLVNDGMVLRLLNSTIQSRLRSLFPEDYKNVSTA